MNFEQLPREITPPANLEGRTVTALRGHGLLRRHEAAAGGTWRRSAAAVAIFAAGAWFGMAWAAPAESPATHGARFMLLLEGAATADTNDEARVFEEYRAWATQLRSHGRFVGGARLGGESAAVPGGNAGGGNVIQGYFVVSAADIRDAVKVAESSPHVARGGRVVVRPIDTR